MKILLGFAFLFVLATAIPTPRRGKGSRHDGIEVVEEPDRFALAKGLTVWGATGLSVWLAQRLVRKRMQSRRNKAECIEAARNDIARRPSETDDAYDTRLADACDAQIEMGLWPAQQISRPSTDEDGENGDAATDSSTPNKPKPRSPKSFRIDAQDFHDMISEVGRNVAEGARNSFRIGDRPLPPPRPFIPAYAGFR